MVVEDALAGRGVRVEQAALAAGGHGHADRVRQALPERAGGGLDALGVPVLRVAGGERAPLAQLLEVVELEPETGQVELDVEGQAGVPGGEDEPVAPGPVRVGRVVPHRALEERVRQRCQAHRGARVTTAAVFDGLRGEHPDGVHGAGVEVGPAIGYPAPEEWVVLAGRGGFGH